MEADVSEVRGPYGHRADQSPEPRLVHAKPKAQRAQKVKGCLLHLKRIGRRWSVTGATNMLATCLVYALNPQRYAEVEAPYRVSTVQGYPSSSSP